MSRVSSLNVVRLLGDERRCPGRGPAALPSSSVSFLLEHLFELVDHRRGTRRRSLRCLRFSASLSAFSNALRSSSDRLMRRRELLRVDDDAFDARGHFERVVLHVFAGPAEDRVQQLLFRRQFALALGRDLADQDVARLDERADLDDAVLVEVAERLRADVRDVAGELLAAELRLADFDVELLDVDRGVGVVLHQLVR